MICSDKTKLSKRDTREEKFLNFTGKPSVGKSIFPEKPSDGKKTDFYRCQKTEKPKNRTVDFSVNLKIEFEIELISRSNDFSIGRFLGKKMIR